MWPNFSESDIFVQLITDFDVVQNLPDFFLSDALVFVVFFCQRSFGGNYFFRKISEMVSFCQMFRKSEAASAGAPTNVF